MKKDLDSSTAVKKPAKRTKTVQRKQVGYNNRGKYFHTMWNREKILHNQTKQAVEAWKKEVGTMTEHLQELLARCSNLEKHLDRSYATINSFSKKTVRQRVHYVLRGY